MYKYFYKSKIIGFHIKAHCLQCITTCKELSNTCHIKSKNNYNFYYVTTLQCILLLCTILFKHKK